jgi:hypothetical protein
MLKRIRLFLSACLNFSFALCLLFPVNGLASEGACLEFPKTLLIDKVWGGTKVGFDAVESATHIYVGYYDKDRWLTISQINKCNLQIRRVRVPSQFGGWDAHNYIALSFDSKGLLHVAANMHVSPLIYARMTSQDELRSLSELRPQVGKSEDRTTYPMFFSFPDGSLGFSYRYGRSGSGVEFINRFDGEKWRRWLDQPLFDSGTEKQEVSAYHTNYLKGPDGNFHVAWVWRRTHDVETNFNVNYAHSPDLKTWYNSRNERMPLPLTPANTDLVKEVPSFNGLFNNIRIGFDDKLRPVISYIKFDTSGATQLWHARSENGIWKNYQSTQWNYRWDPRGGGTIPALIRFSGVVWREGKLLEYVHHPIDGNIVLQFDLESFRIDGVMKGSPPSSSLKIHRDKVKGAIFVTTLVRKMDRLTVNDRVISWFAMPANTRDKQRPCRPEVANCEYVYDLQLHSGTGLSNNE